MAMTPFEKMAIYSVIENMEGQLAGLKKLLGMANSDAAASHKVHTPTVEPAGSFYATEDDDKKLDELFKEQEAETNRLSSLAQGVHMELFKEANEELNAARRAEQEARAKLAQAEQARQANGG